MNAEMQEKVLQGLDDSGFLFEMKAKIRDSIFASLKNQKASNPAFPAMPQELQSDVGKLACTLVYDLLEQFGFKSSQRMLMFEGLVKNQDAGIKELEASLEKKSEKNSPLLLEIVERMFVAQEEGEEGSEDIEEDIQSNSSNDKKDELVESAGTSQGYDQSVNSLAMEEFDYVEPVKKNK